MQETTFRSDRGVLVLTDALTLPREDPGLFPDHEILRRVRCVEGDVELEALCDPRFDFGRRVPSGRQRGALGIQFDGGFRGGELYDMTVGAVSDGTHSMKIRVDGKTGQRTVDLIPSIPYLNRWLADHPADEDSDAPLWCKLDVPDRYSYTRFLKSFKEPADRAGVEKPVTPTNFRKSSATWLAKQGASESYLNIRQGRKQGSKITSRYVRRIRRRGR